MTELTTKKRQHLKAKAHKLKPVVILGSKGLTESLCRETDEALTAHELIKVRINVADKDERKDIVTSLCERIHAELVQLIGRIAIVYRKNEK